MLRAALFDMGGTLDGDGLHWLDRFASLYQAEGVVLPRETLRGAFDEAERRLATDDAIGDLGLEPMVDRHLEWQFDHLGDSRPAGAIRDRILRAFVEAVRASAAANLHPLRELKARGLLLGVVSNGCGNVDVLCREFGYGPLLSVVVDSRRVGMAKPDPAIYRHATTALGVSPAASLMVGDSFDRDVRPARAVGMKTAWLQGLSERPCPDPSGVDIRLRTLAELPSAIQALEMSERTVA
jgi:putative hydrolase of the HAD superfamily